MTRFVRRPLAIALSAVLGLAVIAPVAHAQDPTSTTRTKSMREQRAERMAELGKDKEATIVYYQLIKDRPLSPEAPKVQAKILTLVL